jgi:flagellar biosynthesis/type III secretory pathway chaperone
MDSSLQNVFEKLKSNLEELTKNYGQLLQIVETEKEVLVKADVAEMDKSNSSKELLLQKIKLIDLTREKYAKELSIHLGMNLENPRLLELAARLDAKSASELRGIHQNLEKLVQEVATANKENEVQAAYALSVLRGSLSEIKQTLSGKKNYDKKGKLSTGPDKAGNFASREA